MPPKQIAGRYDVVREVGRGGMGTVWLCTDQVLGREVALKQLGGFPGETSPHVARALREARSSAALHHPNVVSIFDAIEEGDHIWLVMEYLPARTLSQLVQEEGPLRPERAAAIGAQVADGLSAAHARGTIHRDVKPSNILVTEDDVAKISDFGIARTLGEDALTQTGFVSGTPLYFSPELARGATPTPAADVWALGASLYTALEGTAPWPTQENPIAMLVHIANNEPPQPHGSGALAEIVGAMMTVDPEQRPSMSAVRNRLRAVAAGAGPPATAPIAARADRTQRLPVAAAVAAPVDPTPTPADEPPGMAPVPAPVPAVSSPRRSRRLLPALAAVVVLIAAVALGAVLLTAGGGNDTARRTADGGSVTSASDPSASSSSSSPASEEPSAPVPSDPVSSAPEPSAPATSAAPPAPSTGDPAGFVKSYYALLPSDTKDAWALLSSSEQAAVGSYGSYQGFWKTIDAVSVDSATADANGVVAVVLTYTTSRGTESETRHITVGDTGSGTQIIGDQQG